MYFGAASLESGSNGPVAESFQIIWRAKEVCNVEAGPD